jgi:uncharacterized membrane protein YfcA
VPITLSVIAVIVGFCIGTVGVGGVLLIPPMALLAHISIHEASATALFTFIFTGLCGTWLFHGRGSVHWRTTLPVCAGAVVFSYIGAWVNSLIGSAALTLIIALITVFAGIYILLPASQRARGTLDGGTRGHLVVLFGVGAVSGFGAGLSGAGGPLFSVPIMLLLGFAPLTAIGTGQVLQIAAATFGSLANLQYGSIDFGLAGWLTCCELTGVFVGVHLAHRAKTHQLRAMVAGLCIIVGCWMLIRAF